MALSHAAIETFIAKQRGLIEDTYRQAWETGVRNFHAERKQPVRESDAGDTAAQVALALVIAKLLQGGPNEKLMAAALAPAMLSLQRMKTQLAQVAQTPSVVQAPTPAQSAATAPHPVASMAAGATVATVVPTLRRWLGGDYANGPGGTAGQGLDLISQGGSDILGGALSRLDQASAVAWSGEQTGYGEAAQATDTPVAWITEADDHVCGDCAGYGEMDPMPFDEWPTVPGAGETECSYGCRCSMEAADTADSTDSTDQTDPSLPDSYSPPDPRMGMGDITVPTNDLINGYAGKYLQPDGSFTPERQALHDSIVSQFTDKVPVAEGRPTYTMLGGGPASGKSTKGVVALGHVADDGSSVYVDPDAIKQLLPEVKQALAAGDEQWATLSHEESSYLAKRVQAAGFERGQNITLDGTGDGSLKSATGKLETAERYGYQTRGVYVTIPTEEALVRAEKRAITSGRKVLSSVITGTHESVSEIYPQIAERFGSTVLIDNTTTPFIVAEGTAGSPLQIADPAAWQRFLDKAAK
jgi:predicted ABC-type ATPase